MAIARRIWFGLLVLFVAATTANAQTTTTSTDRLPSWNDGPAKQAILDFVRGTTDNASQKYVLPEDRIATFDQDGTLWVEHPMYTQVVYCLDRVPAVVAAKPELANVEPFKTVLSGDRKAMADLSMDDLFKILSVTLTGIASNSFNQKPGNGSPPPETCVGSDPTRTSRTFR
jgi:hypothetical protein